MMTTFSWVAIVDAMEPERYKPDKAYQFSNTRMFESTDGPEGGFYTRATRLPFVLDDYDIDYL
jgi:hypothetical protein